MGSAAFNAQYLQQPDDPSGSMFRQAQWLFYDCLPAGRLEWFQSWDLSFKAGPNSDFVVGIVAVRCGAMVYIVDRFKMRADFPTTKQAILDTCRRFPETRTVLIEEAANGAAVVQDLRAEIPGLIAVRPEGGKQARAAVAQSNYEAGQVWLPNPYDTTSALRTDRLWVPDFMDTLKVFPNGRFDDDVDALSQLLVHLRQNQVVNPASMLWHQDPDSVRHLDAGLLLIKAMRAKQMARSLDYCPARSLVVAQQNDTDEEYGDADIPEPPVVRRRHPKIFFDDLKKRTS
jgi:predicted phage terminase large subunit-like protein